MSRGDKKTAQTDLLQGTLDLLVLKTLQSGSTHGWDIAQRIKQISQDALRVGQGSLYSALHRLEAGLDGFRMGERRRTTGERSITN